MVIPVARKLWQQTEEGRPARRARRFTIASTSRRVMRRSVSCRLRPTVRKRGVPLAPARPAAVT
jgi:hypothetical protein